MYFINTVKISRLGITDLKSNLDMLLMYNGLQSVFNINSLDNNEMLLSLFLFLVMELVRRNQCCMIGAV